MQRITKDPETRRQEIIDAAIALFNEKGYEQTSMLDISKRLNVSQGLCYRYFKSKEEIHEAALECYINSGVQYFSRIISNHKGSLWELLENFKPLSEISQENDSYGSFVNKSANSIFHMYMQIALCEKLVPLVTEILENAKKNGEIHIENAQGAASFCLMGQLGIWMNDNMIQEEKIVQTKKLIRNTLGAK